MVGRLPREIAASTQNPGSRYELELTDRGESNTEARYRRVPGGDVVFPTGRVLVRYSDDDRVEEHRREIEESGYEIDTVLSYAPQAAWVRASSGDKADALAMIGSLASLPGIVNVEPQMIGRSTAR